MRFVLIQLGRAAACRPVPRCRSRVASFCWFSDLSVCYTPAGCLVAELAKGQLSPIRLNSCESSYVLRFTRRGCPRTESKKDLPGTALRSTVHGYSMETRRLFHLHELCFRTKHVRRTELGTVAGFPLQWNNETPDPCRAPVSSCLRL